MKLDYKLTYLINNHKVKGRNYTRTLVEYGKWYLFSPNAAEDSSGSININFPSWTSGQ